MVNSLKRIKGEKSPAMFSNAMGNGWDIFNQIVGVGGTVFNTAGTIGQQIQGNKPLDEGSLGGGIGNYEATSGLNADTNTNKHDEKKVLGLPTPLFWGAVILLAVGSVYFIASGKMGKAKAAVKGT